VQPNARGTTTGRDPSLDGHFLTSVKTVRLCLQLGHEHSMPWGAKLDPSELPTGSKSRWVSRSPDGLLVRVAISA
jgi:hypothetical protein